MLEKDGMEGGEQLVKDVIVGLAGELIQIDGHGREEGLCVDGSRRKGGNILHPHRQPCLCQQGVQQLREGQPAHSHPFGKLQLPEVVACGDLDVIGRCDEWLRVEFRGDIPGPDADAFRINQNFELEGIRGVKLGELLIHPALSREFQGRPAYIPVTVPPERHRRRTYGTRKDITRVTCLADVYPPVTATFIVPAEPVFDTIFSHYVTFFFLLFSPDKTASRTEPFARSVPTTSTCMFLEYTDSAPVEE